MVGYKLDFKVHERVNTKLREFDGQLDARMVAMKMTEAREPLQMDMPRRIDQKPPAKPNVYIDGSLQYDSDLNYRLGGLGSYWPAR